MRADFSLVLGAIGAVALGVDTAAAENGGVTFNTDFAPQDFTSSAGTVAGNNASQYGSSDYSRVDYGTSAIDDGAANPSTVTSHQTVEGFQAPAATPMSPPETVNFITTLGAVALALAATLIAIRVGRGAQKAIAGWRGRFAVVEAKLDRAEAVFSAQSQIVIIWDEDSDTPAKGWGRPKVLGNSTTLATLLRYAAASEGTTPIEAILEGLSKEVVKPSVERTATDFSNGTDISGLVESAASPLMQAIQDLRWNGTAFELTVATGDGRLIEITGNPAGGQAVVWVSDVTSLAQASAVLRDKLLDAHVENEQLKRLLNSAPFPVWRRKADLRLAWVNQSYADAVELRSPDEVVERAVELDSAGLKLSNKARETGEFCLEKHYVVIGGKRRALDFLEMPHAEGSVGMALDVTGIEQAERQLKRHVEAQAETLDKLATAVAIFGSDKQLLFYNHAYAICWQLDPAWLDSGPQLGEMLDRLRADRALPEQADFGSWKEQQLGLFNEIKEQPDQLWHLPDGRHLRVVCQAHPMGGLLFVYEDVTDRFKLETSLNTLSKVQRATLDNLSEGVAVFGSDGLLELYNRSFEEIWQLTGPQIAKKPHVKEIIAACRPLFEDDSEWLRIGDRMAAVREERHGLAGRLERGDARFIDYAILPLPNGATLFTCLDVTDTTRITKALQERNEALEHADKLKSEFISHVSYQLRTPLTTIKGYAEMLDRKIGGELSDQQREYSDSILKASNQLMVLMDDILDLARIEAGVMSIEPTTVDVFDVLQSSAELTAREAQEQSISFELQASKELGTIFADQRRLRQIVFNLLSNALTFTDSGGSISLGADRSDTQLRLWVKDTGLGIDPEIQAVVFDRFESKTSVGRKRGAGLGLALVRSFVELHGGWVSLESEPKVGTTVVCYLPTRARAIPPAPENGLATRRQDLPLLTQKAAE